MCVLKDCNLLYFLNESVTAHSAVCVLKDCNLLYFLNAAKFVAIDVQVLKDCNLLYFLNLTREYGGGLSFLRIVICCIF